MHLCTGTSRCRDSVGLGAVSCRADAALLPLKTPSILFQTFYGGSDSFSEFGSHVCFTRFLVFCRLILTVIRSHWQVSRSLHLALNLIVCAVVFGVLYRFYAPLLPKYY